MHQKVCQRHGLNVLRALVNATLHELDLEGLESRRLGTKKKKGHLTTKEPNLVHSIDGHDKMMEENVLAGTNV